MGVCNTPRTHMEVFMKNYNRIVLRLSDEQMDFIKEVAKENGLSVLNAVRLIITRYREGLRYGR